MMTFNGNLAIFVPSTVNVDENIDNAQFVNRFAKIFSQEFGGATITQAQGCWYSDSLNKLVKEDVTIVEAFGDNKDIESFFHWNLIPMAEQLRNEMTQDCVAVRLNGNLYLI